MKQIKNFILLVDSHRRPSRQRNTAGRYRVGAKSAKEAIKLLRAKIGFGSIVVYYEVDNNRHKYDGPFVSYKTVVKQEPVCDETGLRFKYTDALHANASKASKK